MDFFKKMFGNARWRLSGEYADVVNVGQMEADAASNNKRHGGDPSLPGYLLDGNEVRGEDLYYAGLRSDGYLFFGWKRPEEKGGGIYVLAGCQTMALPDAKEYWYGGGSSSTKQQASAFVDAIESWATGKPARKRTPGRVELRHVDDFLGERLGIMFRNWLQHERGVNLPEFKK